MKHKLILLLLVLVAWATSIQACVNEQWSKEALIKLKQDQFVLQKPEELQAVSNQLVKCLASPEAMLRDGIAYEGLSKLLRQKSYDVAQLQDLRTQLYGILAAADDQGFAKPFAALVLSEVARTDRIEPWMTDQERSEMLKKATAYLQSVNDYRGLDPEFGWRHGVAHGSDWLLQLAVNPKLDVAQLRELTDAVALKVFASEGHSYIFGEPGRLARPVLFAAKRDIRTEAEWLAWLQVLLKGMDAPDKAYKDVNWMAKRQNLVAFLDSLYIESDLSNEETLKPLHNAVKQSLSAVP
ncbi:MAG: DUF2785 domain-containing protein [Arenimonas sp.]|nr:DUF2785 domain-containing protein [Arenimonas sp.]